MLCHQFAVREISNHVDIKRQNNRVTIFSLHLPLAVLMFSIELDTPLWSRLMRGAFRLHNTGYEIFFPLCYRTSPVPGEKLGSSQ